MTFAQRRNCLTTHFSERIPVVKRRMTVYVTGMDKLFYGVGPACLTTPSLILPLFHQTRPDMKGAWWRSGAELQDGSRWSVYSSPKPVYMVRVTLLQTCNLAFRGSEQAIEQCHKQTADKIYNCAGNRTITLQEPTLRGRRKQTERIQSLERNMKSWNAWINQANEGR